MKGMPSSDAGTWQARCLNAALRRRRRKINEGLAQLRRGHMVGAVGTVGTCLSLPFFLI